MASDCTVLTTQWVIASSAEFIMPSIVRWSHRMTDSGKLPEGLLAWKQEQLPLEKVPIDKLVVSESPRSSGVSIEHVRVMAGSANPLPPILIHKPTMRILDGIHRLHAAKLRGEQKIDARLFDGDEISSFVLSVHANTTHGLPLSLADRKAAAARIISSYPQWSDRIIAEVAGLAHQTVASLRERLVGQNDQLDGVRIGRDGRLRPRDGAARREVASGMLADNPGASLRQIARAAQLSPETVRKIRSGMAGGDVSVASGDPGARAGSRPDPHDRAAERYRATVKCPDVVAALHGLCNDPALLSSETGREILQMLSAYETLHDRGSEFIDHIPPHCMSKVVAAARAGAEVLQAFAYNAERRARGHHVKR